MHKRIASAAQFFWYPGCNFPMRRHWAACQWGLRKKKWHSDFPRFAKSGESPKYFYQNRYIFFNFNNHQIIIMYKRTASAAQFFWYPAYNFPMRRHRAAWRGGLVQIDIFWCHLATILSRRQCVQKSCVPHIMDTFFARSIESRGFPSLKKSAYSFCTVIVVFASRISRQKKNRKNISSSDSESRKQGL